MSGGSNSFNLLRLVLAFLVIVSHTPELIDGDRTREPLTLVFGTYSFGEFSVRSFFILSGFLISGSWLSAPRLKDYLIKRLLRIYPAFLAAVAVCVLIIGPSASPTFLSDLDASQMLGRLPVLRFTEDGFPGNHFPHLNGALWTIRYELTCYLLLGLAGVLGVLKHRYWILALFAASLVAQQGAGYFLQFASFFLAGVCARLFPLRFEAKRLAVCAVAFIVLMCSPLTAPIGLAVPWTYLLLYLGSRELPEAAHCVARNDLSYGLYLYGWPIQSWLIQQGDHAVWRVTLLATLIGLVCAVISWLVIERPALSLKPHPLNVDAVPAVRLTRLRRAKRY